MRFPAEMNCEALLLSDMRPAGHAVLKCATLTDNILSRKISVVTMQQHSIHLRVGVYPSANKVALGSLGVCDTKACCLIAVCCTLLRLQT